MYLSRGKLYTIVSIACLTGYIWLFYNLKSPQYTINNHSVCLIKNISNIPCPSCGTTRSVVFLWRGKLIDALLINPFGLLLSAMMLAFPIWLIFDLITKKQTFLIFYHKTEQFFKKPKIAAIAIFLVLLNWGWNIYKGL